MRNGRVFSQVLAWSRSSCLCCRVSSLTECPAVTGAPRALPMGEAPSLCFGALLVPKQRLWSLSSRFPSSVVFFSRLVLLWAVAALQGVDSSGPLNDVCAIIYPLASQFENQWKAPYATSCEPSGIFYPCARHQPILTATKPVLRQGLCKSIAEHFYFDAIRSVIHIYGIFPPCTFLFQAGSHFRCMRIRIHVFDNCIFSPTTFLLQSSWNKSVNQAWTNSITRYGDTNTKEPLSAVNGSLKLPSSAGQKLLLQALVYDAVMVGVFGALLTCVFSRGFSI